MYKKKINLPIYSHINYNSIIEISQKRVSRIKFYRKFFEICKTVNSNRFQISNHVFFGRIILLLSV